MGKKKPERGRERGRASVKQEALPRMCVCNCVGIRKKKGTCFSVARHSVCIRVRLQKANSGTTIKEENARRGTLRCSLALDDVLLLPFFFRGL